MSTGDVLTILGLLIAIVAILSENKREYILFRIGRWHWTVFIGGFIIINYLIFYNWFSEKFSFLSFFHCKDFPTPSTWAYITALLMLIYFVYSITKGSFVRSKFDRLIIYYKKLLTDENFGLLSELIETNHKSDIISYLNKVGKIEIEGSIFYSDKEYEKKYKQAIGTGGLKLAAMVYGNIILDKTFIERTANLKPYFFTDYIRELNSKKNKDVDFVNLYLNTLLSNKNYYLQKEVLNNNNFVSGYNAHYRIEENNKILEALLSNIRVAEYNEVYNPFGNSALREISRNKNDLDSIFLLEPSEWNDEKTKDSDLNICIIFFDIMIRAGIYQYDQLKKEAKGEEIEIWHLWLYYFRIITTKIIQNLECISERVEFNGNDEPSYYHKFLYDTISTLTGWLNCCDKLKTSVLVIDICKCLGGCLHHISESDKLSNEFKRNCFDNVLRTYFRIAQMEDANQDVVNNVKNVFIKHWGENRDLSQEKDNHFICALGDTWNNEFDKVPFEDLGVYDDYIVEVLVPLGID